MSAAPMDPKENGAARADAQADAQGETDAGEAELVAPWPRPRTADALHALLEREFQVVVPRRPLVEGHQAPFDYLCHAFFEAPSGRREGEGPRESQPESPVEGQHASEQPASAIPLPPAHGNTRTPRARDCVVWANRGGGKTFLGAVATMLDLVFKPGIAVRILGGSLEQSRRMHEHLARLFEHPLLADIHEGRVTQNRLALRNGSACEVLAQSQTSVRGTRVQKLRCDEVELFDPEVWEAAQLTTRSRQCGGVFVRGAIECLSTLHRPYGLMFHIIKGSASGERTLFKWGVVDVLGACGDERSCRGGSADGATPDPTAGAAEPQQGGETPAGACPLYGDCQGRAKARDASGSPPGHLHIEDAILQKQRVGAETWASEMLCLRPTRTDSVLPEFNPDAHVVRELPRAVADVRAPCFAIAGMDFGFRSPTVVLRAVVDVAGTVWVVHERVAAGKLLSTHVQWLRSFEPPPEWVGVDPAGRQRHEQTGTSNIALMRREGLVVREQRAGLAEGIMRLRGRLAPASGPPRLFVHERCSRLIESLQRYRYPEGGESLVPVKDGHDHAVDALRYLVLNLDRPPKTVHCAYA